MWLRQHLLQHRRSLHDERHSFRGRCLVVRWCCVTRTRSGRCEGRGCAGDYRKTSKSTQSRDKLTIFRIHSRRNETSFKDPEVGVTSLLEDEHDDVDSVALSDWSSPVDVVVAVVVADDVSVASVADCSSDCSADVRACNTRSRPMCAITTLRSSSRAGSHFLE